MIQLLAVELRRLWSRRLVRWSLVLAFLSILAAPLVTPWAFGEQARIEHDADIERCVQAQEPKVREGLIMPTVDPEVVAPARRERLCRRLTPTLDPLFHLRELDQVLRATAPLAIITGFLIGASSIGADWQTGVLSLILTWESRRARIVAARVSALAGSLFLAVVAWQALLGLSVAPFALLQDTADGLTGAWWGAITGLGVRVAVVAAGAALIGFALALAGRATAVALGAGFGYLLVAENLVGSLFKPARPWLMLWNGIVFVKGRFAAGGDVPGRSVLEAALLLVVYAAAITGAATVAFRRRDV